MNKRANIAAGIEKNRIALLRIVFCWLAAAFCLNVRSERRLPPRLARYVSDLLFKAEKATYYLLIAIFYHGQIKRCATPDFDMSAMRFTASNRSITLGALTVAGIIKRLKSLQHLLHNLHFFARQLAKSIAARARIEAMKTAAMGNKIIFTPSMLQPAPEHAIPP